MKSKQKQSRKVKATEKELNLLVVQKLQSELTVALVMRSVAMPEECRVLAKTGTNYFPKNETSSFGPKL